MFILFRESFCWFGSVSNSASLILTMCRLMNLFKKQVSIWRHS